MARKRTRANRRRRGQASGMSGSTLTGSALLSTVKGGSLIEIPLIPKAVTTLAGVAMLYEGIRWNSVSIMYKTSCSSQTAGMITVAWDMEPASKAQSRDHILKYGANINHAVTADTRNALNVPTAILNARRQYIISENADYDTCPLTVLAASSASPNTSVGEIWIRYNVTLIGQKA